MPKLLVRSGRIVVGSVVAGFIDVDIYCIGGCVERTNTGREPGRYGFGIGAAGVRNRD